MGTTDKSKTVPVAAMRIDRAVRDRIALIATNECRSFPQQVNYALRQWLKCCGAARSKEVTCSE